MHYNPKTNSLVLSTGKSVYANNGRLGICESSPYSGQPIISEGYDGYIWLEDPSTDTPEFTKAELLELISYVESLWAALRADVEAGKVPVLAENVESV